MKPYSRVISFKTCVLQTAIPKALDIISRMRKVEILLVAEHLTCLDFVSISAFVLCKNIWRLLVKQRK